MNRFESMVDNTLNDYGYKSFSGLMQSLFQTEHNFPGILVMGMSFAYVDQVWLEYIGIGFVAWLLYMALIVFDLTTGTIVAIKVRKEQFNIRKFARGVLRMMIYTILIGLVHMLSVFMPVPEFMSTHGLNPYSWIFYVVLHTTVVLMLMKVLKNAGRLGWLESALILRILHKKLNSWFDISDEDNPPPVADQPVPATPGGGDAGFDIDLGSGDN